MRKILCLLFYFLSCNNARGSYGWAVTPDGFKTKKISSVELAMLLRMTSHRDSYGGLWKNKYEISKDVKNGTLYIKRKCHRDICKIRADEKLSYIYNLDAVDNKGDLCEDLICASKRIFGDPKGVYLAHALDKYGLQLSRYSDPNADPDGFDIQSLKSVIVAANSTPQHLQERTLMDTTFYRFLRGKILAMHSPNTVADASGAVFDRIDKYASPMQTYGVTHEIGHRASKVGYDSLEHSKEWLKAAGFKEVDSEKIIFKDYKKLELRKSVSKYGDADPSEDFAETYAMYRFAPKRLKKESPQRYQFMKEKVFKNIEYSNALCDGKKQPENSPKNGLKLEPSKAHQ